MTREAANKAKEVDQRDASSVPLMVPPTQEEIELHELTHVPYAPWCSSCIMARGRQDKHEVDDSRKKDREIPTVSMDYCFTGYEEDEITGDVADEKGKLVCLVLHDSMTGCVHAVPVDRKGNLEFLCGEVVRFISFLGYGEVILKNDQEPVILKLQRLIQKSRTRLGLKTTMENPPIHSHSSNGAIENSILRTRGLSNTLLQHIRAKSGLKFSHQHPIVAWSWHQAAWLLNHYSSTHGMTPYELLCGHGYKGKTVPFGEPILAFTATEGVSKGQAKWTRCIFLGKSVLNDMYICGCEGRIQLTRSVRRNAGDWTEHVDLYMKFNVSPWKISGVIGSKLIPDVRKPKDGPIPVEMESFGLPLPFQEQKGSKIGAQEQKGSKTGAHGESVKGSESESGTEDEAASDPPSYEPSIAPNEDTIASQSKSPVQEQAGINEPMVDEETSTSNKKHKSSHEVDRGQIHERDQLPDTEERPEKRQREEQRKHQKIQRVEYAHHDINDFEEWLHFGDDDSTSVGNFSFGNFSDEADIDDHEHVSDDFDPIAFQNEELIFRCFTEHDPEPNLGIDTLKELDRLADQVEVSRLSEMGVLLKGDDLTDQQVQELNVGVDGSSKPISAKFVRTWRMKHDTKGYFWLRRSRAVAREFQFLEEREDVFSPASSSAIVRLIPALYASRLLPKHWCLCSFDISDAFLLVPQEKLRWVKFIDTGDSYVIARCLPGQRDGSKRWFEFFTNGLEKNYHIEKCLECPALLRSKRCAMLMHVDDVFMCCDPEWLENEFLPSMQEQYKMTVSVCKHVGESVDFLKRKYTIMDEGIMETPSSRHVKSLVQKFMKYNGRSARLSKTPHYPALFQQDESEMLSDEKASQFRSLVGLALYISHDRWDISFAVKSLAAYLKTPAMLAWKALSRVVGYVASTPELSLMMKFSCKGSTPFDVFAGVQGSEKETLIEVHTDSDWQGSFGKSTSCAIHFVNGNAVHFTCRSQKVVSLSSTESEWYAACAGVSDCMFIKFCCGFIISSSSKLTLRLDNNGAIFLSHKAGSGRIKHMPGKYLWLQQLVTNQELDVKKIATLTNTSDLGTKGLARNRMYALMYMIGFVDQNAKPIGELEYQAMMSKGLMKQELRHICRQISQSQETTCRTPSTSTVNMQMAKRVLAVTMMSNLASVIEGKQTDNSLVLQQGYVIGDYLVVLCFGILAQKITEDVGDIDKGDFEKNFIGLIIVYMKGMASTFVIAYVMYMIMYSEYGMIELIYQYIKLIIELVIYICLVAQVRKVRRGLSLIVQLLSFHVVSIRAEDMNQIGMPTSDVFTLRVMVVGLGVVLATLYFVKRLIDEFMDVLHGLVHDMNEIRRSVEEWNNVW